MKGRCETCRHWDCESFVENDDVGFCQTVVYGNDDPDQLTPAIINSPALLQTHKTFGCMLWEMPA